MNANGAPHRTVVPEGSIVDLIDQTKLPWRFERVRLETWQQTAAAIRDMVVRGAGAIGATGAAGLAQAAANASDRTFREEVLAAAEGLRATRPTAQNLFVGIDHVWRAIEAEDDPRRAREAALQAARDYCDNDVALGAAIGQHGAALIRDGMRISTHCNAGWLAFVDWGSALAPIYVAHRDGLSVHVWVDETRPRGQGARLTAWELGQEGVPHAVISDGVAASLMLAGEVDMVIVGADRIARNGDTANKIGTYPLALAARAHGVPFFVAAPMTTVDLDCPDAGAIPIEERSPDEVQWVEGPDASGEIRRVRVVTPGARARNPAFDVTPASLITGIVTERGVIAPGAIPG